MKQLPKLQEYHSIHCILTLSTRFPSTNRAFPKGHVQNPGCLDFQGRSWVYPIYPPRMRISTFATIAWVGGGEKPICRHKNQRPKSPHLQLCLPHFSCRVRAYGEATTSLHGGTPHLILKSQQVDTKNNNERLGWGKTIFDIWTKTLRDALRDDLNTTWLSLFVKHPCEQIELAIWTQQHVKQPHHNSFQPALQLLMYGWECSIGPLHLGDLRIQDYLRFESVSNESVFSWSR